MPIIVCPRCANCQTWSWEEAFDKFGFNDGDGLVMTSAVVSVLRSAGYAVKKVRWGVHNTIITSIKKKRRQLIPETTNVGYDKPRDYLPADVVDLLDDADLEVHS